MTVRALLPLLALLMLACEESPAPSTSQPEPQRFSFTATLGQAVSQAIQLVPDEVVPAGSETPDTISLDFGLASQNYLFSPSGRGTLRVDVRVRNNFAEDATAIIVVLKSIQPATGRSALGDDRPLNGVDNKLGAWRYTQVPAGQWSPARTWSFNVPNNSGFLVSGEVWAIFGNVPPVAHAGGPYHVTPASNGCTSAPGVVLTLNAAGSADPDPGDLLTYEWDTDGDGQYDDAVGASPAFTFTEMGQSGFGLVGDHTVGVRVTDIAGATATSTATVTVANVPLAVLSKGATMASSDGTGGYGRVEFNFNRPVYGTLGPEAAVFWERYSNTPYETAVTFSGCKVSFTPERPIGFNFPWEMQLTALAELHDGGGNLWVGPESHSFSTGGKDQVVFTAILPPDTGYSLYLSDSNGGHLTKLPTFTHERHVPAGAPRWSYDGLYITYAVRKDNEPPSDSRIEMRRFSLIDFKFEVLSPPLPVSVPSEPSLSPDNRRIAYAGFPIFAQGTCSDNEAPCTVVNRNACADPIKSYCLGIGVCSDNFAYCTYLNKIGCESPNATCILEGYCSDNRQVCDRVSDPAGVNKSLCGTPATADCVPANNSAIHIWDTENGTVTRIPRLTVSGGDTTPHFSPDGKSLLYMSSQQGTQQLWKFTLAGTQRIPSTTLCRNLTGTSYPPCRLTDVPQALFGGLSWHPRGDTALVNLRIAAEGFPLRFANTNTGLINVGTPFAMSQPVAWGTFASANGTSMIAINNEGNQLIRVDALNTSPVTNPIINVPDAVFLAAQWYFPARP